MTATIQPESKSASRRALLAGALGGIGAWAASAIGRTSPVQAQGEIMHVGDQFFTATSPTRLTNTANTATVFEATSTAGGMGIFASGTSAPGVQGASTSHIGVNGSSGLSIGVFGETGISSTESGVVGRSLGNSTGVLGNSSDGSESLPAAKPKTGVFGYANQDSAARGVWGHSPAGIGVYGQSSTGYAGYFFGKVFSTKFYELAEVATPGAPGANKARLFIRDNGSGKTQLCVRFATGSVKLLATE